MVVNQRLDLDKEVTRGELQNELKEGRDPEVEEGVEEGAEAGD